MEPRPSLSHKVMPGNRPSSMIVGETGSRACWAGWWPCTSTASSPRASSGGSTPFDQWGVELGKVMAKKIAPRSPER